MRLIILLFLITVSSSYAQTAEAKLNDRQPLTAAVSNVAKAAQTKTPKKPDAGKVRDFVYAVITGFSEIKNEEDVFQPPFSRAILSSSFFDAAARVGGKASIVPLENEIAPFDLKIVKSNRIEQGCDGSIVWETEYEPITDERITSLKPDFEANPRDTTILRAVVIYPAVVKAVLLSKQQIGAAKLPKSVRSATVEIAVDIDDDGQPDLIMTADKSFKKVGGNWQLMKEGLDEDC